MLRLEIYDITRSVTDVFDSDLFTIPGQLPLSTTLTGYLLVAQTDYVMQNLILLPPGTDIVITSANPFPGGFSLKVTADFIDYYILGNWAVSVQTSKWEAQGYLNDPMSVTTVFGLITPGGARKRRLMRRKLMLRTNQVL